MGCGLPLDLNATETQFHADTCIEGLRSILLEMMSAFGSHDEELQKEGKVLESRGWYIVNSQFSVLNFILMHLLV